MLATAEQLGELAEAVAWFEIYHKMHKEGERVKKDYAKLIAGVFDALGRKGKKLKVKVPIIGTDGGTIGERTVIVTDYVEDVEPQTIQRSGYTMRYPKIKDVK